jgi:hypothetical protein
MFAQTGFMSYSEILGDAVLGATKNFEEAQKLKLRCSIMEMIEVQVVA